jgi:serine/threonine-protein kinase RsbT
MPGSDPSDEQALPINSDADVVQVRQLARALAVKAGLSLVDQTKLITAASELARNTLVHGGGGHAIIQPTTDGRRSGVRAEFVDEGPGIADIERALQDGWTSGSGLGLGLPGSRRLVDVFDLETEVGKGTRVTIVKWGR